MTGCRLLWTDNNGLIKDVSMPPDKEWLSRWTGELSGNAVIAATDADGNTLWSWHLWITDYDPDASAYTTPAASSGTTWTFMDRNLGAP